MLNHLEIKKPLVSYYKQIEHTKTESLIEKLLEGKNIALVSDAGTPAISDPGEVIVKKAIENNIKVIPIPGACAFVNALIASGISTNEFYFVGFLPVNKKEKKEKLEKLINYQNTLIFYEAPHKLLNTLKQMMEIFGNRKVVLAREITKIHEEFLRGTLEDILNKNMEPKGEYVVIIEGNDKEENEINFLNLTVEEHYKIYEEQGLSKKEIIKKIAHDRKVPKNEIYKKVL